MEVIFTYIPIRLKDITEIYLKYSIEKLNNQNIIPTLYSDHNYFYDSKLKYKWITLDIDEKYKREGFWPYAKLKTLSLIDRPFIHLDNDLVVHNFTLLKNIIIEDKLNLCYKHDVKEYQIPHFEQIFKMYSDNILSFKELNNTSIIATNEYKKINEAYKNVLNILENKYDSFLDRIYGIPPITLNQQYLNLYFNNINYLFNENPSFKNVNKNGVCHLAEKNMVSNFVLNKNLI